jgi:hypothetical protein
MMKPSPVDHDGALDLTVMSDISNNENQGYGQAQQPIMAMFTSKVSSTARCVPNNRPIPARRSSMVLQSGHPHTPEEIDYQLQRRRRTSLTFAMEATQVIEIPRYDRKLKQVLFYSQAELNLMQCEANMRSLGMDPQEFDWRSFR